jgi:transcriptional regulator with XRE-family HTH domain
VDLLLFHTQALAHVVVELKIGRWYLLGRHLNRFREGAGLSLRDASRKLEMVQSQVSRVENGGAPVRGEDVELACKVYGVTDTDLVRALMDLAKDTRQSRAKNWLSSYADVVSDNFALYVGLESAASALAWYEAEFVPGLLQTREYARSVMELERFTGKPLAADWLERRLEFRLRRQQLLTRDSGAPELTVVVGEAALRRGIGGSDTMAGQLAHLLEVAQRPKRRDPDHAARPRAWRSHHRPVHLAGLPAARARPADRAVQWLRRRLLGLLPD